VKKALEGLKGVTRASVNLRAKEAVVTFDPGAVTVPQMIEIIDRLGFRAALKDSPRSATPPATR
jgi:copper chaperone CopZ